MKTKEVAQKTRLKRISRSVKAGFCKAARWTAIPVLAAGLMLVPAKAKGDEKVNPLPNKPDVGIIFNGGVYEKLKEPFFGVGFDAGHSPSGWLRVDISGSIMAPIEGESAKVNEARLGLTAPLGERVSVTPWVSHSKYYGDDWEVGAAFHFKMPNGAIHVAPHVVTGGYFPFPIILETNFGLLGVSVAIVPIVNHGWMERPAPIMSVEGALSLALGDSASLYLKAVEVTVIEEVGVAVVGAFNMQGGVRFGL